MQTYKSVLVLLCLSAMAAQASIVLTPLDAYVAFDDGCFNFEKTNSTVVTSTYHAHVWNLTSQCWQNSTWVSNPVWWHYLVIIIPLNLTQPYPSGKAMLYITGGTQGMGPPDQTDGDLQNVARLAVNASCIGAVLYQVPNQPLVYPWDPWHAGGRVEDAAIAITWWRYITMPQDPTIILEFPMTKAGVKALDAFEVIAPMYGFNISDIVVLGASKRGWTTWLVGAVDAMAKRKRVTAIVPIVLDALNLRAFFGRQYQFYNGWTFALSDYYNANVTYMFDTPGFHQLQLFVDPYSYRERLTMPKLAVNAVGDEFQMPDDHRYWAHEMPGEMNLLMVKNAEHTLATNLEEALQGIGAFVEAVVHDVPRPNYTWSIDNTTGTITVRTSTPPANVTVAYSWSAEGTSTGMRDFRWMDPSGVRPLLWFTTNATQVSPTTFTATLSQPSQGWVGFIIEIQWENTAGPDRFYMTSPTSVVPNTFPFPPCYGAACHGKLV